MSFVFKKRFFYRFVRHPLLLGFMIAFWATPKMTWGHLVFAIATTAYMLIAIQFEERDMANIHGDAYRQYQQEVSMLTPLPKQMNSMLPFFARLMRHVLKSDEELN